MNCLITAACDFILWYMVYKIFLTCLESFLVNGLYGAHSNSTSKVSSYRKPKLHLFRLLLMPLTKFSCPRHWMGKNHLGRYIGKLKRPIFKNLSWLPLQIVPRTRQHKSLFSNNLSWVSLRYRPCPSVHATWTMHRSWCSPYFPPQKFMPFFVNFVINWNLDSCEPYDFHGSIV